MAQKFQTAAEQNKASGSGKPPFIVPSVEAEFVPTHNNPQDLRNV
jgi:hypothetical protein